MLALVEQKLKIDLFNYYVNYVSYLFRLSDAIMDCSACYIKPFLLARFPSAQCFSNATDVFHLSLISIRQSCATYPFANILLFEVFH